MKNNIKRIRTEKNITQEKLAQLSELSYSTIRNIEKERTSPSIEIAYKIANILEQKIEEIFPNLKKD